MPEIPEVEAFKEYIKKECLNKKIKDVSSSDKKLIKKITFTDFKRNLIGKKFISAERKGKYLIINLNSSKLKLVMHFGLTGSLAYKKDAKEKVKFSKVTFVFVDNSALHWLNKRKFGHVWLVEDLNEIKKLGKDATKFTEKQFIDTLKKHSSQNIKSFLMDQETIAGIGNEYSDEILFQAGIDPHHSIDELSEGDMKNLYKKMKSVLKYFMQFRQKNIKELGEEEYFSNQDRKNMKSSYLQAHRHTDNKCPKNNNHVLKKVKIAGRSAYYCPIDQK